MPILEYSYLRLRPEPNVAWAVLDAFDMYSPAHDLPKSLAEVKRWCVEAGLADIEVGQEQNGGSRELSGRGYSDSILWVR